MTLKRKIKLQIIWLKILIILVVLNLIAFFFIEYGNYFNLFACIFVCISIFCMIDIIKKSKFKLASKMRKEEKRI